MLIVILNWLYILLTCSIIGAFTVKQLYRILQYKRDIKLMVALVAGIIVTTVYAGFFSLLSGVGAAANIVMLSVCLFITFREKQFFMELLFKTISKTKWWECLIYVVIILICAFFTANGDFMYDTGLYHAQTVHWIETYGVVKGTGNMMERLAYNSSYMCFAALYSMKGVFGGQSLHATGGFGAAMMLIYACSAWLHSGKRLFRASNICRLAPCIYTAIIFTEIISLSTDYLTVYLVMWLFITWLELLERKEQEITPYALLCVVAAFLVSMKLTAGMVVVLVIYPAVRLVREKKYREIAIYIGLGLTVVLPYFIRNVIISGWLIYPADFLDLFRVDWKMDKQTLIADAEDVKVWARRTYDRNTVNDSILKWFPTWWNGQEEISRLYTIPAFASIVLGVLYEIAYAVRAWKEKNKMWLHYGFFKAALLICFISWLLSAPLHRYGYAFVLFLPLAFAGLALETAKGHKWHTMGAMMLVIILGVLYSKPLYDTAKADALFVMERSTDSSYVVVQKDYPKAEMESAPVTGNPDIWIYYPKEAGGQSWYYDFPATTWGENMQYWESRGDKIKDGFRVIK